MLVCVEEGGRGTSWMWKAGFVVTQGEVDPGFHWRNVIGLFEQCHKLAGEGNIGKISSGPYKGHWQEDLFFWGRVEMES